MRPRGRAPQNCQEMEESIARRLHHVRVYIITDAVTGHWQGKIVACFPTTSSGDSLFVKATLPGNYQHFATVYGRADGIDSCLQRAMTGMTFPIRGHPDGAVTVTEDDPRQWSVALHEAGWIVTRLI